MNLIPTLSYERFYDDKKLIELSRNWIRVIFKELFKQENLKESETLKDILFMYMDSLKPDKSQKQYNNLNEKLYNDIDSLSTQEDITNQLSLLLSILEGSFTKTEKAKTDFYAKSVNLKILLYLPKISSDDVVTKIFSLINSTLPVFNNTDPISEEL